MPNAEDSKTAAKTGRIPFQPSGYCDFRWLGAAGGGKTYALLFECLRHYQNPKFGAVIFRKNSNQVFSTGGLWDTAMEIYPLVGGVPRKTPKPMFRFRSGAKVTFAHLENASAVLAYQGSQIPLICFDELTHFDRYTFFYMLSRNRSACGIKPYVRCTTNPDSDSWVAEFISWWIDPQTGYAIPERSGVIRYMGRLNETILWGDTPEEVVAQAPDDIRLEDVKSVTFILSKLTDNQALLQNDPGYMANLKALSTVERERLLEGNWKIRPAAGLYFKRSQVEILEELPDDVIRWVRAWDMAATEDKKNTNPEDGPAYTAGVLIGKRRNGRYIIADVVNQRLNAEGVQKTIYNTAVIDKKKYKHVKIRLSQDPGQAGKAQIEQYIKMLAGFSVSAVRETGSKETRAEPLAAQWQAGNVDILMAEWNEAFLSQYESFPETKFKDMVDAGANGFNELVMMHTTPAPPVSASAATRSNPWRR